MDLTLHRLRQETLVRERRTPLVRKDIVATLPNYQHTLTEIYLLVRPAPDLLNVNTHQSYSLNALLLYTGPLNRIATRVISRHLMQVACLLVS